MTEAQIKEEARVPERNGISLQARINCRPQFPLGKLIGKSKTIGKNGSLLVRLMAAVLLLVGTVIPTAHPKGFGLALRALF